MRAITNQLPLKVLESLTKSISHLTLALVALLSVRDMSLLSATSRIMFLLCHSVNLKIPQKDKYSSLLHSGEFGELYFLIILTSWGLDPVSLVGRANQATDLHQKLIDTYTDKSVLNLIRGAILMVF